MKASLKRLQQRYRYSFIVFKELVKTDFQLRYQGSFLGVLWSVLKPLMLFCVMYVVFVRFLHFTDGTPTFPIVLLCGTCLWSFFSEATSMGLQSIVNRGDLLRKVHFPTYIIVASVTMGSMISLAINLGVVIVFGLFTTAHFTWRILLVPLNVFQLYILALGIAMILSTMFVYYRDIAHIWEVVLQAMFYAVPIIYPLSMVQKNYPLIAKFMLLDPAAQVIMDVRHNLISPENVPTVWTLYGNKLFAFIPLLLTVLIFMFGLYVFRSHSRKFAEVL
ncbi:MULTISPECIES: ABC transporter permease [Bifidobacterium]|uniref:Transport permease protein n=2 Tax=Bifidobacterium TaxID=1678 RepID=A0A0F4M7A1_9BIFI|nr:MULTISPECIES: ABC transporter permease [Bifidobacterium]MBI0087044.1 ABC transporter permease [Bifidobacterium sp. M0404]MBI0153028.1 ABC transporter permease [Bifidobacterium sp. M0399]MCT6917739.1 ABC transporter permease [Bifidobacteriales bacterium]KJY65661.1 ABC-2 type transporter [Bifidobacterium asteroides]MBI0064562.1 ABC transporter permease [Bifidobacterium polysaccharolyticum]